MSNQNQAAITVVDLKDPRLDQQTRAVLDAHGVTVLAVYQIPLTVQFRGITQREGLLLRGPGGWAEAAPFWDYDGAESSRWLAGALEIARDGLPWPNTLNPTAPSLSTLPVRCNVTVPVVEPRVAAQLVEASGAKTAKVKVADKRVTFTQDLDRLAAVREALGPGGHIRIDVNALWTLEEALEKLPRANRAAGGLQYAEQPCAAVEDLASLRRRQDVPIAADESVRRAEDPLRVARLQAADVLVVKAMPLGGVRAAGQIVQEAGLPVVVSSALDTSVGLTAGICLAHLVGAGAGDVTSSGQIPEAPASHSQPALSYDCGLATGRLLAGEVLQHPARLEGSLLYPADLYPADLYPAEIYPSATSQTPQSAGNPRRGQAQSAEQAKTEATASLAPVPEAPAPTVNAWLERLGHMAQFIAS